LAPALVARRALAAALAFAAPGLQGQAPSPSPTAALLDYYARVHGQRYENKTASVLWVMRSLADKHDTGAASFLEALLKQGLTDQERAHAADALWILGDPKAVPRLVEALRDSSTLVAGFAASGLGDLGDASAVPPLLALFERLPDNKDQAKARVADALGKLSDPRAIGPLSASVAAVKDPSYLAWAQPALQRLKSGAAPVSPHPRAGVTGRYFIGDGLSMIVNLTVDRERYELTSGTDMIGVSPRRFAGRVSGDGGRLLLTQDAPSSSEKDRALVVVRWGARLYLVDDDQMKRFCDDVGQGVEPRAHQFGRWLLRVGDEAKPVPKGSRPETCRAAADRR
jgi:hypothetical protein